MIRVISSPSRSATGLATLILAMRTPENGLGGAEKSSPAIDARRLGRNPLLRRDERDAPRPQRHTGSAAAGGKHRRGGPGDGQFRPRRPAPGGAARRLAADTRLDQRFGRGLAARPGPG